MDKKTILTLFSYAALAQPLLLLTSCTADEQDGSTSLTPIALTATMAVEDDGTTRAGTAIQSTQFAQGETFYAYFPSNVTVGSTTSASHTTFTTSNGNGATSPATTPYMNAGQSSATVHAYYPSTVTNTTSSFSVQTAQNTDANYKSSDLMYATGTVTKSGSSATGSLTFTHKMAKILVTANIGAGVTNIQSIKIVGGYRTINISTPLSCTLGTSLSNANSSTNIIMWSGTSTNTVNCAALIPPQTISGNFLQIVTDKGTATYSLASSKSFAFGSSYQMTITVNAAAVGTTVAITGWSGTGNVTVNPTVELTNAPSNAVAVDLGLPSGVKWANMNVGATAVTDYGTFFAWGETAGLTVSGATTTISGSPAKTIFDWYTYAWCNGTYSSMTKYCNDASYWDDNINSDTPDGKTQLELGDDAARANWGGKWRMPTETEMGELVNNTDQEWTTINSVAGRKFMKKSDHSVYIFLPAAGGQNVASFYGQGSFGFYWSSTLRTGDPELAWYYYFYSSYADMGYNYRYYGYPVRAVQSN